MTKPEPNQRSHTPTQWTDEEFDRTRPASVLSRRTLLRTAGAVAATGFTTQAVSAQSAASGPTVYVGFDDGTLYAVDAVTGDEEWAFTQSSEAIRSSPTVVDGTVYAGSDDTTLYAVDAATGEQEWAFTEPSSWVRSSPTVIDGTVYVGANDETLYAVDAATGEQQWQLPLSPSSRSSPTVVDGTLFIGGRSALYAVDAGVDGSSEDSRVMLGTLGHHEDWRYSDQSINIPAYALYTTWVRNNSELLAIGGISIGGTVGGGYLLRRRSANKQSDQESADESSDGVAPTSETEQPSPATEKTDNDSSSSVDKLRSEAETAVETAATARENNNLSGAADAYTEALSGYQDALEEVDAGDTETRAEIEDVLNTIRDDLEAVRTRQEQRDDLFEALKAGERSFQEGIVAYTEGGHTLAKIRFRQARGAFEQAVDLVENTDNDDLLNPPIEVSVQSDSELASTTLGELPPIPEGAVSKLADAGVETIGDLESSDESPWPPAVVEPLVAEEIISDDAVAMLTLLSWWEDTDSYEFDTAAAISRRRDQAGHGFNQSS